MLWSLGLAAAAGIMAALLAIDEVMVRVMFTGLAAAAAALLLLLLTKLIDRERTRPAGLLGMSIVMVEFLLALGLIWIPLGSGSRVDESMAMSMLFAGMAGIAAVIYAALLGAPSTRLAGWIGLCTTILALAALLTYAWRLFPVNTGSWSGYWLWAATGWTIGGFGALASVAVLGTARFIRRLWRWAGVIAIAVAAALVIVASWTPRWSPLEEELICLFSSLGAVAAHANMMCLAPLKGLQRWVRVAAIASGVALAVCVNVLVFFERGLMEPLFQRFAAAFGIATGCATVAVVVLAALNRRGEVGVRAGSLMTLSIVCPRCRKKQELAVGKSRCSACNLRFDIRVEEPRCPQCEYLLYLTTGDRCPECGASIEAAPS